jgi:NADP-dependent 3-hydroxy acid dehydrogenase YdfG
MAKMINQRVAIVARAGSGFGRAPAKEDVDVGIQFVLRGRRLNALQQTIEMISGDRSHTPVIIINKRYSTDIRQRGCQGDEASVSAISSE